MKIEAMIMPVTINLHLKGLCIETEARNEFSRLMDTYFQTDDVEGTLDEKIELLREFIENSDFTKLRASDMRFTGDHESTVTIKRNDLGKIVIDVL